MSRWGRRTALIVVGLLVLAGTALTVALTQDRSFRTAPVQRGSLEATIETVGQLTPRNPISVWSPANGHVSLVAAKVGDTVQAGDVLVQLDQTALRDALRAAEQQLVTAERELQLAEQQAAQNPSPQQLSARAAAEQRVREAEAAVAAAQAKLEASVVLAPKSGTVLELQVTEGAPVAQGALVARLADLSLLDLRIELDEIDLPHVQVGMPVTFTLDAYPGQQINGTISHLAPTADTTGGSTTFPATVAFDAPPDRVLRPGMNASVSIQTALRDDVLLIPEAALRTVGRRTFVTVIAGDATEEREIQTGLRSGGMVEVASGLDEGERVVLQ